MMWGEFAVDPAAMTSSFERFAGLIDRFGVDQGRVISDFAAGSWLVAVIDAAKTAGLGEIAQASVVERLRELRGAKGIVKTGRTYRGLTGGWLVNAAAENAREPFHAVISETGGSGCAGDCRAIDARNDRPPFRVEGFADVPRLTADIAGAAAPLLRFARQVHLIDPHITFTKGPMRTGEWVRPLAALISRCRPGATATIHLLQRPDKPDIGRFIAAARQYLRPHVPQGAAITLRRWEELTGGQQFHDRAILTDMGGMTFGSGLDEGPAGSTVHVQRLDASGWKRLLAKFDPATSPYRLADNLVL